MRYLEWSNSQIQKAEQRSSWPGSGGEIGSCCLMGTEFVWDDEKVLEMDSGNGAQHCEYT